MTTCARDGCDNIVSGRRKWCSEPCRKSQYAGTCVGCGEPTNGSGGRVAHPRCNTCARAAIVASGQRADMVRGEARRQAIARMVRDGRKNREIAEEVGTTVKTVSEEIARMRRAGWDLPYRPGYGPTGRRCVTSL